MSLPVLVVLVVVGIALAVAAVHFTGGSRTATLADANAVLTRFAEDYPDEQAGTVWLTSDRKSAFLDLANRRIGIVHSVGDCYLTRIVTPDDLVSIGASDANTLAITFRDFTWKGGRFVFATPSDASAVLAALSPRTLNKTKEAA